ncbi:MAG TPA: hypothetical protein VFR84_06420 [Candidatus Angelobacter sp.]|nr:hypothetical protein [Candidatus Angelobacter sp.]
MLQPVKCPVCGRGAIEPVLQKISVRGDSEDFHGQIGGLKTYRCKVEGHVFFVRVADLEDEDSRTIAS